MNDIICDDCSKKEHCVVKKHGFPEKQSYFFICMNYETEKELKE